MQLLSSVCLHFMHITLPSSVYGLRFFGFLFLSPESGEILMKHLTVYTVQQSNRDNCRRLQKQQPQVEQQQRVEVPFQLELFFPDQSKSKVHKPIDMSNNNLASLPHRVCTVIYTFTSSLPSEFSPNCLLSPLPTPPTPFVFRSPFRTLSSIDTQQGGVNGYAGSLGVL